jgi:hypothetical protein
MKPHLSQRNSGIPQVQYILVNEYNEIEGVFDRNIIHKDKKVYKIKKQHFNTNQLIGKKMGVMEPSQMKIAIICNWRTLYKLSC